jgi:hypothetical protein
MEVGQEDGLRAIGEEFGFPKVNEEGPVEEEPGVSGVIGRGLVDLTARAEDPDAHGPSIIPMRGQMRLGDALRTSNPQVGSLLDGRKGTGSS